MKYLIGLLLVLSFPTKSNAQIIIQPQDYISGSGAASGPLFCTNGSVTAPSCGSWISEPTSGWYRNASGDFRFSIAGTDRLTLQAGNIIFGANVSIPSAGSIGISSCCFWTGVSSGIMLWRNELINAGVQLDLTTDGTMKYKSRAAADTAIIDVHGYSTGGVLGATHAACSTSVTAITVTGGIITAITCT